MEYRDNEYFNEKDIYLFKDSIGMTFKSKVEFDKGYWTTVESLRYKAITLLCKKI